MSEQILRGDVREQLSQLPDGSVQTCITSPPYWGLRDYGTADWEGGDPHCDHTISMDTKWNDPKRGTNYTRPEVAHRGGIVDSCFNCGAKRIDSQLGLEPTPEAYVENMVAVFREVWRVLADDGTLWLNLGDSYSGNPASGGKSRSVSFHGSGPNAESDHQTPKRKWVVPDGLKPKDLVGIPWRVAFALQADGWYLRQDIIWHKPNPMPESVRDRCTKSHEYLFLLTKQPKYYYDYQTTQEEAVDGTTRNKRDVWTIPTKPFKGAHFAVMPEALVEPCILAGSKAGDTVLDPFAGSGTVGVVAKRHHRNFVGVELNPEYAEMAERRIASEPQSLFVEAEG